VGSLTDAGPALRWTSETGRSGWAAKAYGWRSPDRATSDGAAEDSVGTSRSKCRATHESRMIGSKCYAGERMIVEQYPLIERGRERAKAII
jgi:hypothetical protein